jgi:2-methylcitrate dehydratase PrpD
MWLPAAVSAVTAQRALSEFVGGVQLTDLPAGTHQRLRLLLADMAAVSVAGRPSPASLIAADHAAALHPGDEATSLYDGRRLGAAGAAFANGVLANVLDFDDGHRLTKGHPGAVVIPAAVAVAQLVDAGPDELVAAIVVGYEIAIRAGIALHARDPSYHASGAWGGLGAAAAAARLLGLDAAGTATALGLAEYHAPIAPIMRSCAKPAMTKDACAWGASVGVSSALLAARGFTSVSSEFLDGDLSDLGLRWRLEELYVKAFPCCRWSQGAIALALAAHADSPTGGGAIERVRVRTFGAADGLAKGVPTTTEEAQYSLVWPVACALVRGEFTVPDALGRFDDAEVAAVAGRIEVQIDPELDAAFPARRVTAIELELGDGTRLQAGPLEAPGEPDDPGFAELVEAKVAAHVDAARHLAPGPPGGLRGAGERELLGLLCNPTPLPVHA